MQKQDVGWFVVAKSYRLGLCVELFFVCSVRRNYFFQHEEFTYSLSRARLSLKISTRDKNTAVLQRRLYFNVFVFVMQKCFFPENPRYVRATQES